MGALKAAHTEEIERAVKRAKESAGGAAPIPKV